MGTTLISRRFMGTTAAAAAAWTMMPVGARGFPAGRIRDIEGVQVGAISYSFRALPSSAEDILGYLVKTGMTTVELMGGPAEGYAGAPEPPPCPGRRPSEMSEDMLNLDVGHYVAGTDRSPIPVIQKDHDRISHLHLKDRKKGRSGGDSVPWGQGDTPLAEVLKLLKAEQYPLTAMIELAYPIPEGSDVRAETARCVEYCRDALS